MSYEFRFESQSHHEVDLSSVPWGALWRMTSEDLMGVLVRAGKEVRRLGDVSQITCLDDGRDITTISVGETRVHGVASKLKSGEVVVNGDVGRCCGVEMTGGRLIVHGNAGDDLGAAMPGKSSGMRGGEILVFGNASRRVGAHLRRGIIAVRGDVGEDCAMEGLAGTVIVVGKVGAGAGVGMKRVSLIVGSDVCVDRLRYQAASTSMPTWLRVYFRSLMGKGFAIPPDWLEGLFQRWTGDRTGLGKGEVCSLVETAELAAC